MRSKHVGVTGWFGADSAQGAVIGALLVAGGSMHCTTSFSADAGSNVAAAVEEVLVTARRREESLQEVPIAISAFGADDLAQRGVESVQNMNSVAPNLSIMGGGVTGESQASFRVRGIPGVAVYVDGVNQASTDGLLTLSTVEVERIEVLRGPQGTLFGNSSLGGAVHYVTKAPGDTYSARIQASIGSFNRRDVQGTVDLPLSDAFKTKFTIASQSRDGFMNSTVIDRAYGDINDELYRADFLWTPFDSLSLRYNVETSTTNRNGPARAIAEIARAVPYTVVVNGVTRTLNTNPQVQAYANAFGIVYSPENNVSGYPGGQLGKYETRVGWENPGLVVDTTRHTLDANWTLSDGLRVRSITGYKELERSVQVDFDGADEIDLLVRDNRYKAYNFSQELQLLGGTDRFDWVLGAYYAKDNTRLRNVVWTMPEFTCDLWTAAGSNQAARVTAAERTACFNNRKRALGVSDPNVTTQAQLNALNPNLNGVNMSIFTNAVGANSDNMTPANSPESRAYFGDLTWRATDRLNVALGLRYSKDTSDGNINIGGANLASRVSAFPDQDVSNWFGFVGPLPAPQAPSEYSAITKRLTLQYQWKPDLMTYVSYSDGYGPGTRSQAPPAVLAISAQGVASGYMRDIYNQGRSDVPLVIDNKEQTVKNYEVGLRADWLGGAIRTNLTAFYTDWQNVPVAQYVATTWWDTDGNTFADSQIDADGDGRPDIYYFPNLFGNSVAKAEAKGIEFEGIWRATDALRFNLNVGYLKTAYKELGSAAIGVTPAVEVGTVFPSAPELTANIAGSYEFLLPGGARITPRLDYTFTDDYTLQSTPAAQRIQEGYGLLNARISYDSGANWNVNLQGLNLTNEYYFNSGFYTRAEQIHFLTVGRPREWGLTFNFAFK